MKMVCNAFSSDELTLEESDFVALRSGETLKASGVNINYDMNSKRDVSKIKPDYLFNRLIDTAFSKYEQYMEDDKLPDAKQAVEIIGSILSLNL